MVSNTYCVVFLFCFSSSCVPYVTSFSGLSIFDCRSVFSNVYSFYFEDSAVDFSTYYLTFLLFGSATASLSIPSNNSGITAPP